MSDKEKIPTHVSNEAVIEDLTKNLEKSLISSPDISEEYVINPGTSAEYMPSSSGDASNMYDVPLTDTLDIEKEETDTKYESDDEQKAESDSDSIDEVALKDAEADLTVEEKELRKTEAEDLKNIGNDLFRKEMFKESILKYTEGLKRCPLEFKKQRAFLYCNRAAAKMKLKKYEKAVKDCTKAIELDDKYLKAYHRRAQSYEFNNKLDESLEDYKKILELDLTNKEAQEAIRRLPPLIEKRNEELKTEMLGKLKDLGNMILKPFGLSTENFQLEQDPESKGYKINFKK